MSRLSSLLREVEKSDPLLAAELEREVSALSERRAFGLNFERHVPESVELPGRPIRRGDKVRFIPARKEAGLGLDNELWRVVRLSGKGKARLATLSRSGSEKGEIVSAERFAQDLVAVAEFRDPIFPGLVSTGQVKRGGDAPFHSVINAENFHALEMLLFTHEGSVDAIYIDPPFNTGAKDWKYNNDYVDSEDRYRHSKWLAFMERRLLLARRLLNPQDSVLVVAIDEKEYLRLGLLLEQTFPEAHVQMVSTLINPAGGARSGAFGRSDEFLFFVMLGDAGPQRVSLPKEWASGKGRTHTGNIRWDLLRRSGHNNAARADRPALFYPIYVDPDIPRIVEIGEPLAPSVHNAPSRAGLVTVLPIRKDGSEGNWQAQPSTLRARLEEGRVRVDGSTERGFTIYMLKPGEYQKVLDGEFEVTGHRADGSLVVADVVSDRITVRPSTQWRISGHDATQYGTRLLDAFLPGRRFPFPKSLYSVEDALRFFTADKPNATIVDFFAGSGTTAHAVLRLNKQDGGRRRCLSVTNNEVSSDEQERLRSAGHRPGDAEWEALGICDFITKPRIAAAITGETPDGSAVKGNYKFTDEFPFADGFVANVEFFKLTYESPRAVAHHKAFERIAPLLWLRAGSEGRRIESVADTYDVADTYGVLFDLDHSREFVLELRENPRAHVAFIVTDDDRAFQSVCSEISGDVDAVRLYSSYLKNFEFTARSD